MGVDLGNDEVRGDGVDCEVPDSRVAVVARGVRGANIPSVVTVGKRVCGDKPDFVVNDCGGVVRTC